MNIHSNQGEDADSCQNVIRTVARARGGEGPTWGCTMIPLLGDTFCVMQPQVSLTWGRTHTRAAPGDDICMYVRRACRAGSLACHGATRAWAELIAASDPLSVHGYREVNPCPVANRWPVASTHRSHLRHMSAVYHLTPPGDGEATPGDMAVQGAAPPGDTASLGAARGWPLPPPCAGYRTYYISRSRQDGSPGRLRSTRSDRAHSRTCVQ